MRVGINRYYTARSTKIYELVALNSSLVREKSDFKVHKGTVEKVAFPRFCDGFREKIESLQIDICLSIGDLQTFDFFRKARERWGNGLFQQPHKLLAINYISYCGCKAKSLSHLWIVLKGSDPL